MWKQLFDYLQRLAVLSHEVAELRKEQDKTRRELDAMRDDMRRLAYELRRIEDKNDSAHRETLLRLELALERFEKRLPRGE